jgi:hypothetical protein
MKQKMKINHRLLMQCALFTIVTSTIAPSCGKDHDDTDIVFPLEEVADIKYAISIVSGAYPSQTTYMQGLKDLNLSTLDNSNAIETASFASMRSYGGFAYLSSFGAPATLSKYSFSASGKAKLEGKLIVPGANTFSSIEFLDEMTAFASVGGGLARVVIFNPKTLQITGEVNLNSIQKKGAGSTFYLGMKARNGKLFMGVHYFDANFSALHDSAFVAVIDIESKKVDKLIADGRTSAVFISGASVSAFAIDANEDIYIQGTGSNGVPSGILRIKKGETDFDPGYFFDLKAATGQDCYGFYHFGAGQTFTCRISDPADPYESKGQPNYEYYKIDLAAKTSGGKLGTLPKIYGSAASSMRKFSDSEIVFVVSGADENAIYRYTITDGTVSKMITLPAGKCTGLAQIK